MTSYTYAIPDIHGRHDLLTKAFLKIGLHARDNKAEKITAITLGDYVDRGPDSKGVIRFLMGAVGKGRTICLFGNHEKMFLDLVKIGRGKALKNVELADDDEYAATLVSYGIDPENPDWSKIPQEHLNFLFGLPLYHQDKHRIYVHAYLNDRLSLSEHTEGMMIWTYFRSRDVGYRGKHIVHGHEALAAGPFLGNGRTNLDAMAWYTGRLCVGVFDDNLAGGPTEIIEVKGKTHKQSLAG